jgi:VIT1/CCC1 family predicted Fe2+/Mn2+ transporter
MSTHTWQLIYWISTALFSLMMAASAVQYLTSAKMKAAFEHLGFPSYFRVELAFAKFIGVIVLLAPVSLILKEWAYAGFTIVIVSAIVAHASKKDPAKVIVAPVITGLILAVSYYGFHMLNLVV